jgi:hypothetical protein
MKNTLLALLTLIAISCTHKKPFVIINKYYNCDNYEYARYYYEDARGCGNEFTEKSDKYNVGDTIK